MLCYKPVYTISFLYFIKILATIEAPPISSAQKVNSTAYNITWNSVADGGESSIVLGYQISRHNVDEYNSSEYVTYTVKNESKYCVVLNGFQPFLNYCIQARAFTNTQEGPMSDCYFVTPMDGNMTVFGLIIND